MPVETLIVKNSEDLDRAGESTNKIVVESGACNDPSTCEWDLSKCKELTELVVGDNCFQHVKVFKLIEMSKLKSVEIGKNSFTQHKNSADKNPNRHFYLKNCPKLKSLKIGGYSFSDFSECVIENVGALEVIDIGELNKWSYNFISASLELKSILIHNE